ncbi:MAG: POTRA domain-containing protein, partial [Planctomycetota bacterium]|nr:POTRA domain-containing protein [Planctomycetota bacterium]
MTTCSESRSLLDLTGTFLYAFLSMIRHTTDLRTLLPLALWLLCHAPGSARTQEPPDVTIGSVEFPGRTWVPYRKLLEASGLRPGDQWGPESGSRALEGLLKLEFIEKAEPPTIVSVPGKAPVIRITITEHPLLEAIEITGSAALSKRSLKDSLPRKEGSPFRREDLELARETLRRTYQEDGFLFAQVDAALQTPVPGRVRLLLDIEEGLRASIRDVFIIGNSELTRDEIIEISGLRPERLFGAVDRGYFVPHQLDRSLDTLRNYYRSR